MLSSGFTKGLTIIVRVKRDTNLLPFRDVRAEVFDLVGIDIWGSHFDCRGEVEDDGILDAGFPGGLYSFAHLQNEVEILTQEVE